MRITIALLFALVCSTSTADEVQYETMARELLRELIPIRTAAGHKQVPRMAQLLADRFIAGGFDASDVHIVPVADTAALVVRYRASGSSKKPIMLMAHMDVVDALREDWEDDPFVLREEDGYFYGRGTADNKGDIALLTTTFLRFKAEGFTPTRDLILVYSGDEESSGDSIRYLLTKKRSLVDAEFALNSDAGGGSMSEEDIAEGFAVQAAEKTYATFELTVRNRGGHSSLPRSDNAIYELAAALGRLSQFQFPAKTNEITLAYFEQQAKTAGGELGKAMARFAKDPNDEWAQQVLMDTPSLIGTTRTTCVATMLKAGHAENALPQTAMATVNCRVFPGESPADVGTTLKRVVANDNIEIEELWGLTGSPASPLTPEIMDTVKRAVHAQHPGIPVTPYMAPYYTDGRDTRAAGIPTYGVSPMFYGPDDDRAHGQDERISVRSFYQGLPYWHRLLRDLAGPGGAQ